MRPLLSILMPALAARSWRILWEELRRQAAPLGGAVELLYLEDNGECTSGSKRQYLAEAAAGAYRAFVDDDDWVAEDYVSQLCCACAASPDVAAFDLVLKKAGRADEVWRFGGWPDDRGRGRMTVNHLCAWRRELADRVGWCLDLGYGDDQLWYKPLFASGLVRRVKRIEKPLYIYQYSLQVTANQQAARRDFSRRYWGAGLRVFRDSADELLVETGRAAPGRVRVRDRANKVNELDPRDLKLVTTVPLQ